MLLFSLQVCDHKLKIMAVDAKFGGAAHDSFVWSQSDVRRKLKNDWETKKENRWLLGKY